MGIFNRNKPVTFVNTEAYQVYSRIYFCEECAKANRPFRDLKCILYGRHRIGYYVYHIPSLYRHPVGFTPHLISLIIDDNRPNPDQSGRIGIKVSCGINYCGVKITYDSLERKYTFVTIKEKIREYWLPLADVQVLLKQSHGFDFKI